MAGQRISARITRLVAARARHRCEYCRAPQAVTGQTFHIDHILPLSRGGQTTLDNLALACPHRNLRKRNHIDFVDAQTQRRVDLFNPRSQRWAEHFRWRMDFRMIIGRTSTGRATVKALDLNNTSQMRARRMWVVLGLIP